MSRLSVPVTSLVALLLASILGCNSSPNQGSTAATRATEAVINAAVTRGFCPEAASCQVGDFASSAIQNGGPAYDQVTALSFPVKINDTPGYLSMSPVRDKVTTLNLSFYGEEPTREVALDLLKRLHAGYGPRLCLSDSNSRSETLMQLVELGLATAEWPQQEATFKVGSSSVYLSTRTGDGALDDPAGIQISCSVGNN